MHEKAPPTQISGALFEEADQVGATGRLDEPQGSWAGIPSPQITVASVGGIPGGATGRC